MNYADLKNPLQPQHIEILKAARDGDLYLRWEDYTYLNRTTKAEYSSDDIHWLGGEVYDYLYTFGRMSPGNYAIVATDEALEHLEWCEAQQQ